MRFLSSASNIQIPTVFVNFHSIAVQISACFPCAELLKWNDVASFPKQTKYRDNAYLIGFMFLITHFFSVPFDFILFQYSCLFQELEKSLKATCEEFIMSITKLVVDPMLSFVTKVVTSSILQTLLHNLGASFNVLWHTFLQYLQFVLSRYQVSINP